MAKKAKTNLETKKTSKKLKTQIQRTRQTFLHRLQVAKESCEKNRDSNDSDHMLYTKNTSRKSSSRRYLAFSHTNVRNEDTKRDNFTCYRCQHFLEIPRNLSQPCSNRTSTFIERCKVELNFVQAIVWLKSVTSCASQIPVEQLQQIFDRQWNTHSERHHENKSTDVERLRSPVNRNVLISERRNIRDTFVSPNISDVSYVTPQRMSVYTRSEDTPQRMTSYTRAEDTLLGYTLANDPNQSPVESLLFKSPNNCHITAREKKKGIKSCIIPETDVESILSEDVDIDRFNSTPEHQCFEFEKNTKSVQNVLKSGIEQINKKIIENKHIFQKNYTDVLREHPCRSNLPARNQSIDLMFDLENNGECSTSMRNQNDKVLESDGSPKSFIITQKDISQISNVDNDEFLFDNSPWQVNNSIIENSHEDSAYSTAHNDIFNYNIAKETTSVAGNKRLSDTEYYKLQPCKKKTMYQTEKLSSSTNGMMDAFDDSPKSLIITQKDISQILDVYNDEKSEFQIVSSCDEQMSDSNSENSKDNATIAVESIDKYKLNTEKMTASSSTVQRVVTSNNIKHCYNLQTCNKRISYEKESLAIPEEPEEHKARQVWNLSEKENENEGEMISANWLNFTLKSLHVEHVIIKSIKVILTTLCDKKTVEEYTIKEWWRNTRNYWEGSLEEEAVNAVLNISDIFITEKKPNICIKIITTAIVKILNEMTMRAQLNKIYSTETSLWIYRVQIILELCNLLPICVKVIDYLITRLKSLQSVVTNVKKIQKNTYVIVNQLHLVFYALNITLQKYRTIIPSNQRSRSTEKIIPHVADLWKIHYIDKELEYTGLDLDATEKRWLNALEKSAIIFTKHFAQFAKKSFSLVHVLISQSSTRIT